MTRTGTRPRDAELHPSAGPEDQPTTGRPRRWVPRWVEAPEGGVFLALVVTVGVFASLNPTTFMTIDNARNVITDASILIVLAVAVTMIIITAGIDLSIGSVLVFSQVVAVRAMAQISDQLAASLVGLVVALIAGLAWGLINGLLIGKAKLPPLIATLATLGAALGASQLISGGGDLAAVPTDLVSTVGLGRVAGIPAVTLIAVAATVAIGCLLAFTGFGRRTYAIGSSIQAARRAGIGVDRHLIAVYALAGTLYGLAAFMSLARFGTTDIGGHSSDALNAIVASALGGASLFGGIGTILGTVIGVFIPSVLKNGLIISGLEPFWQNIAIGAALAAAVYADQVRRARRERGGGRR